MAERPTQRRRPSGTTGRRRRSYEEEDIPLGNPSPLILSLPAGAQEFYSGLHEQSRREQEEDISIRLDMARQHMFHAQRIAGLRQARVDRQSAQIQRHRTLIDRAPSGSFPVVRAELFLSIREEHAKLEDETLELFNAYKRRCEELFYAMTNLWGVTSEVWDWFEGHLDQINAPSNRSSNGNSNGNGTGNRNGDGAASGNGAVLSDDDNTQPGRDDRDIPLEIFHALEAARNEVDELVNAVASAFEETFMLPHE